MLLCKVIVLRFNGPFAEVCQLYTFIIWREQLDFFIFHYKSSNIFFLKYYPKRSNTFVLCIINHWCKHAHFWLTHTHTHTTLVLKPVQLLVNKKENVLDIYQSNVSPLHTCLKLKVLCHTSGRCQRPTHMMCSLPFQYSWQHHGTCHANAACP